MPLLQPAQRVKEALKGRDSVAITKAVAFPIALEGDAQDLELLNHKALVLGPAWLGFRRGDRLSKSLIAPFTTCLYCALAKIGWIDQQARLHLN